MSGADRPPIRRRHGRINIGEGAFPGIRHAMEVVTSYQDAEAAANAGLYAALMGPGIFEDDEYGQKLRANFIDGPHNVVAALSQSRGAPDDFIHLFENAIQVLNAMKSVDEDAAELVRPFFVQHGDPKRLERSDGELENEQARMAALSKLQQKSGGANRSNST